MQTYSIPLTQDPDSRLETPDSRLICDCFPISQQLEYSVPGDHNMMDEFKDECGVFGIFNHEDAARLTYLGLYALQHRGQEPAGIVSSDGQVMYAHKGMGYVSE